MVTVITKTIGAGGGYDYVSFTAAELAVENIATTAFGSTDLVANDGAIVFEAAAGTYTENVTFSSTLTADATRQVTYKPAVGSEHGGAFEAGVVISLTDQKIQDDYMALIGLQFTANQSFYAATHASADGLTIDSCLFKSLDSQPAICLRGGGSGVKSIIRNCVGWAARGSGLDCVALPYPIHVGGETVTTVVDYINCTGFGDTGGYGDYRVFNLDSTITVGYYNCLSLSGRAHTSVDSATTIISGSNNFGPATGPFPPSIQGTPATITATTDVDPGPGDWAIYDAATGALIDDPDNDVLAGGIGPDANPDVPTTDIVGNTRSGATTDPGAFEISTLAPPEPALITIMRQIYQQDASFSVGASSAGVEKITHQLGPGSADFFTINSSTSATVSVPRTAHALRVICVVAAKACDVTLDLDASNSVFLGSIGGVASVQTDLTYFWSFGQVVSDGTYPRVRIVNDGFAGDQNVYLWWHLA